MSKFIVGSPNTGLSRLGGYGSPIGGVKSSFGTQYSAQPMASGQYQGQILLLGVPMALTGYPGPPSPQIGPPASAYGGFPDPMQTMQTRFDTRISRTYGKYGRGPGRRLQDGPPYGPIIRPAGPPPVGGIFKNQHGMAGEE